MRRSPGFYEFVLYNKMFCLSRCSGHNLLHLRENFFLFHLQMLPFLVEVLRGLPLVTFPLVYFAGGSETWVAIGVLIFFIVLLVLVFFAVMKTGRQNPNKLELVAR